jgi:hypothetical protein
MAAELNNTPTNGASDESETTCILQYANTLKAHAQSGPPPGARRSASPQGLTGAGLCAWPRHKPADRRAQLGWDPAARLARSSSAMRSARARATRERTVPVGHSQTLAASSYESPTT